MKLAEVIPEAQVSSNGDGSSREPERLPATA